MRSRTLSGLLLTAILALPTAAGAEEPRGRARTWDLEANVGVSVLDTGFDRKLLGYTLNTPAGGSSKVPETRPDHLESTVPTFGLRAGYNFTRFFEVELGVLAGETQVGENTYVKLEENFTLNPSIREQQLAQQTATAPGILAAYDSLDFEFTNANMVGVFKFNNRSTSRWVFYGTLGGGYYSLNPDREAFNACAAGSDLMVFDPSAPIYNGDPNDPFDPDLFEDNPQQMVVDPQCGRGFLTGTQTRVAFNPATGKNEPVITLGSYFKDSNPWLITETGFPGCGGGSQSVDLDTGQILCDGAPQWQLAPGTELATTGFSQINKVNGVENFYFTAGAGARWHFRPRQVLRLDFRRHFDENNNKNINEFTMGWSFVVGRGKADRDASQDIPVPAGDEDQEVPPPADEAGLS